MRLTNAHLITILLVLLVSPAIAQEKLLTLDDLYDPAKRINFGGEQPGRMVWLDENHYLLRGNKIEALTGKSQPFYDKSRMQEALAKLPAMSPENARRLAEGRFEMNASGTAALINYANGLFYYQFGSDQAIRLTNTAEDEVGEAFSPDGRLVSFVRNYNLYLVDIATQRERSLTKDGNSKLFNGRLDWVYQEELYGRGNFQGYWWSPDSTKVTYLQLDESQVKDFTIVDHIPNQQELEIYDYPKAGMPNPKVRLGVVDAI